MLLRIDAKLKFHRSFIYVAVQLFITKVSVYNLNLRKIQQPNLQKSNLTPKYDQKLRIWRALLAYFLRRSCCQNTYSNRK